MRLEECYGSPETIEKALLDKLERFPRFGNKDPPQIKRTWRFAEGVGVSKARR